MGLVGSGRDWERLGSVEPGLDLVPEPVLDLVLGLVLVELVPLEVLVPAHLVLLADLGAHLENLQQQQVSFF